MPFFASGSLRAFSGTAITLERIEIPFPNLSDTPENKETHTVGSVSKWYFEKGAVIKPNTTICDIDIPEQFCFGMDIEEGGTIVDILKAEDEECIAGDVLCIIDDGEEDAGGKA